MLQRLNVTYYLLTTQRHHTNSTYSTVIKIEGFGMFYADVNWSIIYSEEGIACKQIISFILKSINVQQCTYYPSLAYFHRNDLRQTPSCVQLQSFLKTNYPLNPLPLQEDSLKADDRSVTLVPATTLTEATVDNVSAKFRSMPRSYQAQQFRLKRRVD